MHKINISQQHHHQAITANLHQHHHHRDYGNFFSPTNHIQFLAIVRMVKFTSIRILHELWIDWYFPSTIFGLCFRFFCFVFFFIFVVVLSLPPYLINHKNWVKDLFKCCNTIPDYHMEILLLFMDGSSRSSLLFAVALESDVSYYTQI